MRARSITVAVLLAATLSACGGGGEDDEPQGIADPSDTGSSRTTDEPPTDGSTPDGSDTDKAPADTSPEATRKLLDWQPVTGTGQSIVRDAEWTLSTDEARSQATLDGPRPVTIPAGAGRQISDTFLTDSSAVVVAQDKAETKPQLITQVDLASGRKTTLTDPAPGPGGPFAAYGDTLAYATYTPGSDYCLATVDLAAGSGAKGYCAPRRHGFTNVSVSPEGTSMMTFDAKRPVACRTLVDVEGGEVTPIDGVEECKGWDVLATPSGHVWSTIPKENRIEVGDMHASVDGTTYDLGEATTGSLLWCGDSAYFSRDRGADGNAALFRWTPEATLELVYEAPGKGDSFLVTPTCAGNVLTIEAYGEGGDETVSATVPG
ncbi:MULTISPECIES: hypothetical protein [unclassified Nocardioides]|uniref:hypothetical protein n=1 Tax=unclassified Nocardioides TaxID=2615069 RepID=UPI0006F81595|nr:MULTISPECIES: hypothetical protein [unclassified Nocardioides]KQY57133.1 hypothetical protein ASD30_12850 [Nocardioides sp. Root140]KRF11774.1 hypothetical protein ASH02_17500 [Nocardioides sp. Soil796]